MDGTVRTFTRSKANPQSATARKEDRFDVIVGRMIGSGPWTEPALTVLVSTGDEYAVAETAAAKALAAKLPDKCKPFVIGLAWAAAGDHQQAVAALRMRKGSADVMGGTLQPLVAQMIAAGWLQDAAVSSKDQPYPETFSPILRRGIDWSVDLAPANPSGRVPRLAQQLVTVPGEPTVSDIGASQTLLTSGKASWNLASGTMLGLAFTTIPADCVISWNMVVQSAPRDDGINNRQIQAGWGLRNQHGTSTYPEGNGGHFIMTSASNI